MGDAMIKVNDFVTRNSYNNDMLFRVIKIEDDICYLKGVNVRLIADASVNDLKKETDIDIDDSLYLERIDNKVKNLDRNDYFYLPGKILHIDADKDYLNRCKAYYDKANLMSMGICEKEDVVPSKIMDYLNEYNPNILVITGHDAYYKKRGSANDLDNYKNSIYFVESIKEARRYEHSHDKLIIIAGACQSNYEELIRAGANFASRPKRINIHALDPAIIATMMSLSDINKNIDLKEILNSTKYKEDGMGGIITKGTMYMGYPR